MTAEDVRTLEECADVGAGAQDARGAQSGAGLMSRRHVTADEGPRIRFGLYRLCECPQCGGRGKVLGPAGALAEAWGYRDAAKDSVRCPECRGEGRIRQCVAECETPEAVGVALVTCAREGEWTNADGDPCAFGLLDRTPECETCEGSGRSTVWLAGSIPRNVGPCETCKGSGIKPTGTWLVLPWMPSARNVRDAGRVLARSKKANRGA